MATRKPRLELSDAPKGDLPRNVQPMLATRIPQPFDHPDWIFEIKWDGYRAIAEVEKRSARLYSRNQLSFHRFRPIVESLRGFPHDAVLDGEVAVLDDQGRSNFHLLHDYRTSEGVLVYQVFDILHLDGHDLRKLPLRRRKEILGAVLNDLSHVRVTEHIHEQGKAFFQVVTQHQLEGMVAKDARSIYREGYRSKSWLKIKTSIHQEAIIGGFTDSTGRAPLGAIILGVYRGDDFVYIGDVGTGFSEEVRTNLRWQLDGIVRKACPFKTSPRTGTRVHWVRPLISCEVSFSEWSPDGLMRHPVFVGLRDRKDTKSGASAPVVL